jgi:uncharacterized protein (DUF1800 family)
MEETPDHTAADETAPGGANLRTRRTALLGISAITSTTLVAACQPATAPLTTVPPTTVPPTTVPPTTVPPTTAPPTAPPTTAPPTTVPRTTVPPVSGAALPAWPKTWATPAVFHVAKRLTFGPTPALLAQISSLGTTAWIDQQLNYTTIADPAVPAATAFYEWARGSAAEIDARGEEWRVVVDLPLSTALRAVVSERQLFERTVGFWWDHLNVDVNNDAARNHCPSYDTDVIRTHALGTFSDLLMASAKSGAMLNYLDQASSRADGGRVPNENYARELMELHTVGVDGGYSEADVVAVSYLFSGWTVTDTWNGTFTFQPARHTLGPFAQPSTSVLDWTRGALTGIAAGESFLRHLARHPVTAQRIAHKLCVRFIGEHIGRNDSVVLNARDVYLANDTAIAPTLRSVLTSGEFASSADRKIRRPLELLAAGIRATSEAPFNAETAEDTKWNFHGFLTALNAMPHHWPTPDGYPDKDAAWVSVGSMISRWNLATFLGNGNIPGFVRDWSTIPTWGAGPTVGEWFDGAAQRLGVPLDAVSRTRMLISVGRVASTPITANGNRWIAPKLLGQLMQQPQFQTA